MKLKRSLCTLLAIVIALSCMLSAGYSTTSAAMLDPYTCGLPNHKENSCYWEFDGYNTVVLVVSSCVEIEDEVYAYVWKDMYEEAKPWPGEKMTLAYEQYGDRYYYAYIPEEYKYVVFNDGTDFSSVDFAISESAAIVVHDYTVTHIPELNPYTPCFHTYGDETEILPMQMTGDVDGNNVVNIKDATAIQKNLAGIEAGTYIESLADVDKSGTVNIKDATAIQKLVAGIS